MCSREVRLAGRADQGRILRRPGSGQNHVRRHARTRAREGAAPERSRLGDRHRTGLAVPASDVRPRRLEARAAHRADLQSHAGRHSRSGALRRLRLRRRFVDDHLERADAVLQGEERRRIPINAWGDIKAMWGEYTARFLNSPMHGFALGRLGNVMEEVEGDKPGDSKLVKTGTAFKAGGSESFGYEPHLLLELSVERKAKRKAGVEHEGEGRMIHRADVLKDRTWALNGKVIRWSDKATYQPGGYAQVWNSLKPHFERVQQTMAIVTLKTGTSSADRISDDRKSEFYERRERRDLCAEEIKATLDLLWGGSSAAEKRMRLLVTERIFGIKSRESVAALSLDKLERGLKILQAFEKRVRSDKSILDKGELEVLPKLDIDIRQFDEGKAQEAELPF